MDSLEAAHRTQLNVMTFGQTRRPTRILILAAVIHSFPASSITLAKWIVNEHDECVRVWTPASMVRGPGAMLTAPTLPMRCAIGGLGDAVQEQNSGIASTALIGVLMLLVGTVEGITAAVLGIVDTATAGYFEVTPDYWAIPSWRPAWCLSDKSSSAMIDRCGRTLQYRSDGTQVWAFPPEPTPTRTPGRLPPELLRPIPPD